MFIKYLIILFKKFSKGFKFRITALFLMAVIGGFLELLGIAMIFPVMLVLTSSNAAGGQTILNIFLKIFPVSTSRAAFFLSVLMIGIFLFKNIFMIFYTKIQNDFSKNWADYVSENVIKKLLFAPYKVINSLTYGDKNLLLFSMVREISLNFVLRCIILFANSVVAFCIMCLLFYKFTLPAFLSMAFILCYTFFENVYFKKKARRLGEKGVKLINEGAQIVNFIINSQKEIILSDKRDYFSNYLMNSSKEISSNYAERISWGNYPLFVTEMGVILAFFIMVVSIVSSSETSKGEIISSLAIIGLMVLRLVPQLNKVLISMFTINVSKQNVIWFLDKYEEISKFGYENFKNLPKMKFENSIELKNLCFKYDEKEILSNVNLKINKGEFIGIIGSSGAGKTTLADIISGLYLKTSGNFLVDNVEITEENISSMQKNVSFLPQESVFLNGNILQNVAFGESEEEINLKKAKEALNKAGLDIDLYSDMNLSVGQKKRVALARAYYRDFEILILDEATAALDLKSENTVIENVLKLKGEKTVIAIAHRLSTLKKCDKIFYLNKGTIEDEGTLEELRERHEEINEMIKTSSFE